MSREIVVALINAAAAITAAVISVLIAHALGRVAALFLQPRGVRLRRNVPLGGDRSRPLRSLSSRSELKFPRWRGSAGGRMSVACSSVLGWPAAAAWWRWRFDGRERAGVDGHQIGMGA